MIKRFIPLLGMICFAGAASAEGFNYTYVEGRYIQGDKGSNELNGWRALGSLHVKEQLYLFASMQRADLDDSDGNKLGSSDLFFGGAGLRSELQEGVDAAFEFAYGREEDDSDQENFYSLAMLIRWQMIERLEMDGSVTYVDAGSESRGEYSFGVQAVFGLTDKIDILASTELGSSNPVHTAGLRWNFGSSDD